MSAKLRLFFIENAVVILFVVLIALAIPVSGLPGTFLFQEILTRLGRNAFLVIALLLPIMAGALHADVTMKCSNATIQAHMDMQSPEHRLRPLRSGKP